MSGDIESVYLNSAPDEQGIYHLALDFGQDDAVPLGESEAVAWARHVMWAVNAAEYDAGVMAQLTKLVNQDAAVTLVREMREDRAPSIRMSDLLGIDLVPGVSAFTGRPFLRLERSGKAIGQWSISDAVQHAIAVLQALENLPMDTAYLRVLERAAGLDRGHALAVVSGLGQFREPQP